MASTALAWTVPTLAAVAVVAMVLALSRRIEGLSTELTEDVRALAQVRRPLARLRHELDDSAPLVTRVHRHWDHPANGS